MALRFPRALQLGLAIVLATIVAAPALAQDTPRAPPRKKPPEAPAKLPRPDKGRGLDFLFGALKAAPDEVSAKHVEARIWAIWMQTPSDTAALLMVRAKAAIDAQQLDVALKLLDATIKLRPDYVEAWNRRAAVYYVKNEQARPLARLPPVA